MKKIIRISVSLLLSALILLSGSGLVIGKMVCLKSGHTLLAAKSMKDCCETNASFPFYKDNCCDIHNISFQQAHFVPANPLALKANFTLAFSIPLPAFSASTFVNLPGPPAHCSDPPLSRSASPSLPLLGIFRI